MSVRDLSERIDALCYWKGGFGNFIVMSAATICRWKLSVMHTVPGTAPGVRLDALFAPMFARAFAALLAPVPPLAMGTGVAMPA